ncbi:unnamed protein product [Rhizophagus irregularis]|nr:unnamed protein product [Rhizophagus irregularis]CAB5362919.1 unnamed protein product [Rhizophagus irregularis]
MTYLHIDGFFKLGLKGWNFSRHSYFRFLSLLSREFSDSFNLKDSLFLVSFGFKSEIFGSFNLESSERNGDGLSTHTTFNPPISILIFDSNLLKGLLLLEEAKAMYLLYKGI